MLKTFSAALATCALLAGAATAGAIAERSNLIKAQYGEVVYHYCYIAKRPYGDTVYFSEAFGVPQGTYAVGIQNDFNSFVTGRFDADVISGAQCMGPYPTMQEARNELNDHLGDRRRAGKTVVTTWWTWRGR